MRQAATGTTNRGITPGICPSCEGTDFDRFDTADALGRPVSIDVCRGCRLHLNANPQPAAEATTGEGGSGEFHWEAPAAVRQKVRDSDCRLRLIEALHPVGTILDVGAYFGHFLQAAVARGWKAHGVELVDPLVGHCREQGLDVIRGDMRHLDFPDSTFDLLNLRHVLEHDVKLWECLAELRRVLKPGGLLVLEVPCVDCRQVRTRREQYTRFWAADHCYFFSRQSIRNLLRRAGFEEVRVPRYGRRALAGGFAGSLYYLGWRTHLLLRELTDSAPFDASVWRKGD